MVLTVKVPAELLRMLDEEAKVMSAEQSPGRVGVSRGELVRVALFEWLATRTANRKPRQ